ncbi:hypothetical protein BKA70DRAFT_206662 [Coprinopsis sp. MPI-PUGE-AT-0042]|nr:hypothetical protein BKA70DRAFT_206662 [Coprinopsis sp. MPI-PUGE-AT-0042]
MANLPPPRRVVVDDLDPLVQFDGAAWFSVNDAKDPGGNFGPTYLSTLHGTNSSTELSFTFDGSSVELLGSNNPRNESGIIDPTWECLVDGVDIGATDPFPFQENNWSFCNWKDGTPGEHTLTVRVRSQGQTFWVDRVQYVPSPKASVASGSVISVSHLDNAITLGDGWVPLGGDANLTTTRGATAEVEFVGTKLSWIGYIPNQFEKAPTTGAYTIDGGPATSFALKGLTESQPAMYNQKFFETPLLSPGPHRVFVVYQGSSETTPLTLTNLLIEGGNFTAPLPGDPSIFAPGANSSSTASDGEGGSKPPIGAIVGGVVGGLAIIAAIILAVFFIICRRKSKERARANMHAVPFDSVVDLPSSSTYEKDGSNASPSNYAAPINAAYHAVPHHQQTLGQGLAPNRGHRPMPSGATDQWSYDPPSSHGHGPPPHHNRNPSFNHYPSPPMSTTNTSSMGSAAPPLRKEQIMLEARNQGSGYTSSSASDSRVVLHEDSGVRMDAQGNAIEVPPLYTVQ